MGWWTSLVLRERSAGSAQAGACAYTFCTAALRPRDREPSADEHVPEPVSWLSLLQPVRGCLPRDAGVLWLGFALSGWYSRAADAEGKWGALKLVMFGPSATLGVTSVVPLSSLAAAYPLTSHALATSMLVVGAAIGWRSSKKFSELSDEAVSRKKLAVAVLLPGLVFAFETGTFALARLVSS